ncbi:MAG: hypothetical protein ACODAG_04735 [Myxococcota bacterium]
MTAQHAAPARPARTRIRKGPVVWMACLLFAICFEGLARKYVTGPDAFFYFLKDGVLLIGLLRYGIQRDVLKSAQWAYGLFILAMAGAFLWTIMQTMNPEHRSPILAFVGLRAYWLWWIAPLVIASAIRTAEQRDRVVAVLIFTCFVVAVVAAVQFVQPREAAINAYAWDETDATGPAIVSTTERVRVSSTFSYLTGFTGFVVLAPGLLLGLAFSQSKTWIRRLAFAAVVALVVVTPMSGSRSPMVKSGVFLAIVVLSSGLIRSRAARRAVAAAIVALPLTVLLAPQAVQGVADRWEGPDTRQRLLEPLYVLPPVAIGTFEFPTMGIGTGMQQTARVALGVRAPYNIEPAEGRYLVELGLVGYLLFWLARIGLVVALIKAGTRLRRAGRRGIGGACFGFALLTMFSNFAFDHVWQALYFTGLGLYLRALHEARTEANQRTLARARQPLLPQRATPAPAVHTSRHALHQDGGSR